MAEPTHRPYIALLYAFSILSLLHQSGIHNDKFMTLKSLIKAVGAYKWSSFAQVNLEKPYVFINLGTKMRKSVRFLAQEKQAHPTRYGRLYLVESRYRR